MKIFPILGTLAASIFLSSCGETFTEVTARHQADFDALNEDLRMVHEAINKVEDIVELEQALDPIPFYEQSEPLASNTLVIFDKHLVDPDFKLPEEDGMTFYFNELADLMDWTDFKGAASEDFESEILAVTGMRYVAVYKIAAFVKPETLYAKDIEKPSFKPGMVLLKVYLFDRELSKVVLTFSVGAKTDSTATFSTTEYDDGEIFLDYDRAESTLRNSLWTNARAAFLSKLTAKTGGNFEDVNGVGRRSEPAEAGEVP